MTHSDDESAADGAGNFEEPADEDTVEMQSLVSEAADLFRSSELFQGLTPEEVREIVHVSQYRRLEAGERLFEQGDPAEAMYIIESGTLQVVSDTSGGEQVVLAELESEAVVGEMSIIGGGERSASVEAMTEVGLFRLSREAFESIRNQDRPAAYKIIVRLAKVLGERRRTTDARIEEVFADPSAHIDEFQEQVHEMLGKIRKA